MQKKKRKPDSTKILAETCELLLNKLNELEKKFDLKADKPEEKVPPSKREIPLGEGVEKISKGNLDTNQVGGEFVRKEGTVNYIPRETEL